MKTEPSSRSPRRLRRLGAGLLLVALAALALAGRGLTAPQPAVRIVAVGDVHGDYDSFTAILQTAGLIDSAQRWTGGTAVLVQTGDILDRGPADRAVLDLLMSLEREAPRAGGRVIVLLGNHEVMNMMGDLRYVSPAAYAGFAGKNSEKRRQAAWRDYQKFHQRREAAAGADGAATVLSDEEWMAAHPPGYFERRDAFGPRGNYGRWLRKLDAVAHIGDTVFLHGGISEQLAGKSAGEINWQVRAELEQFDQLTRHLARQRVVLPFFELTEMTAAVKAEQAALTLNRGTEATEEEKQHDLVLEHFLGLNTWYSIHPQGPLWYRGLAEYSDEVAAAKIPAALAGFGAARFVVGHTPQRDGHIKARFDGRVFLIDTGMLASYYRGRASALELEAGRATAIYPGERVVLHPPAVDAPRAREELPGGGLAERRAPQQPANPAAAAAPDNAPARVWLDPDGNPLPFRNDDEVLEFLRRARVVSTRSIPVGVTLPKKVLLERDGRRMHAIFRYLDLRKNMVVLRDGSTAMHFRDSYRFECAAYELARMLGLDNVPPVIERRLHGQPGSLQAWVEKGMSEKDRRERRLSPPSSQRWLRQMLRMHLFDALVYNTDRNMGNMLMDSSWKLWMVDHTRAFRRHTEIRNPERLTQVERGLWEGLKNLDEKECRQRLRRYVEGAELDALLKRRAALVALIEERIREQGEAAVLYSLD